MEAGDEIYELRNERKSMDTVEQSNDLVIEKNNDKSNDNYQKLVE